MSQILENLLTNSANFEKRADMKQFKVVLIDGRNEFVVAEDWLELGDRYLFTIAGQPRGDTFFLKEHVISIYVVDDDYSPPFQGMLT